MLVLKVKSKNTYTGKDGREHHYYNYYLQCDNGKRLQIKPVYDQDFARLDMVASYVDK